MKGPNSDVIRPWVANEILSKGIDSPNMKLHAKWAEILFEKAMNHYLANEHMNWMQTKNSQIIEGEHPVYYQAGFKYVAPQEKNMRKSVLSRDELSSLSVIMGASPNALQEQINKSFMADEPDITTNEYASMDQERRISESLSNDQVIDGLAKLFGIAPTEVEKKINTAQFLPHGGY
jgi:hypothetical protein